MSHRRAAVVAWGLCALTLTAAAVARGAVGPGRGHRLGGDPARGEPPDEGILTAVLDVAWLVAFAGIGAFVASRAPRTRSAGCSAIPPAMLVLNFLGEAYYWHAARDEPQEPGALAELGLWVGNSSWVPAVIIVLVLLPLLFPTGRPPGPRWRIVAWTGAAGGVALLRLRRRVDGAAGELSVGRQPAGRVDGSRRRRRGRRALWFVSTLAAAASLVVRFRRSHGTERQQIKWFTAAAGQLVVAFAISFSLDGVIGAQASWAIIATALLALALAVAIGVMRYRLYDIDVVINRALVYGGLTATLGGAYLGDGAAVGLAIGRSGFAVAVSTLAVAALFGPARARIQALVDRRFYRHKYDAERTLEAFAARLRDEVALDALDSELRGVVRSTMQPAHVSLWLRSGD